MKLFLTTCGWRQSTRWMSGRPMRHPPPRPNLFRLFANRQTALLAAIYDSIAHAAHDWLVRWLAGRVPAGLGHPLSRLPRVQEKVGQIAGLLLVNRSLLEQAAAALFRHRGQSGESHHHRQRHSGGEYRARAGPAIMVSADKTRWNATTAMCSADDVTSHRATAWLAAGNFVFQSQG